MMNIEQITSRLAQMPDQALQQYAMMHKEDPYIMALAISESRRRKQMRAAAAPQPQAQPKVADQALMEMAPAGVDALPTPEMGFAGGGIVAFADGGDVEHYQVGGSTFETPYDRMNRLNREREERERQERLARIEAEGGSTMSYGEQMGNVGRFFDQFVPDPRNIFKTLVSAPGYGLNKDLARPGPTDTGDEAKRLEARYAAPTSAAPSAARRVTAPAGGPSAGGLGATPEAAAMRRAAGPAAGAPSVQSAKDLANQFYDTKAQTEAVDKYIAEQKADVEAARKRREEGRPKGEAYSKFEEMLKAEEGRASKEKDEATGVAIFKAGLRMMAGTSPRAFENIATGSLAGLEEYTSAMKDMKKAAKERQKAFADIENARRAEARDDWKSAEDFEAKASARMDKARELGVKSIADITGKGADIASSIYKTQVEQQGALQRTQIQASAAQARTAELNPNQRAALADKAMDNVQNMLKTNMGLQMEVRRNPGLLNQLVTQETARLLAAAEGRTMAAAPGAPSPGGNTRLRFDAQGNPIQ